MNKTAQERTLWNKFVENIGDVSGIAAENYFSPDLKKIMETIRSEDDSIRSTVSGKFIGYASPKGEAISLKDLLKSAKSNFNRREYFKSISDLTKFYEKLKFINDNIISINMDVGKINSKFLFDNLDTSYVNQILKLQDTFEPKAASGRNNLVKIAGILDTLHNLFTERGSSLRYWEKYFPGQLSSLKDGLRGLLNNSESLLRSVLGSLKEMAKARAVRNVDSYIKNVNDISSNFKLFEKDFKAFYSKEVKPFVEKEEIFKKDIPAEPEVGTSQVDAPAAVVSPAAPAPAAAPAAAPVSRPTAPSRVSTPAAPVARPSIPEPVVSPSEGYGEYYDDEDDESEEGSEESSGSISDIDADSNVEQSEPEATSIKAPKKLTVDELKAIKQSIFDSNTQISKEIKSLEDKIKSSEEKINKEIEAQISTLRKQLKIYSPQSDEYENILKQIASIRAESQSRISLLDPLVNEKLQLQSKIASNIKNIQKFNYILSLESRVQEIKITLPGLEEKNKNLSSEINTASEERKIELNKKIQTNNELIDSYKSELEQKEIDIDKIINSQEYLELVSEANGSSRLIKNSILNLLSSLSNESPIIIKSVLFSYAGSIKNNNPKIAYKLVKIAKSIKG